MNVNEIYYKNKRGYELAFKYFPCFMENYITYGSNLLFGLNELNKHFLYYLSNHSMEKETIEKLIETFQFITLKVNEEENKVYNNDIIDTIIEPYNSLISEIGSYKFRSRSGSIGDRQTKANNNMLVDILSLKDTFLHSLDIIDSFSSVETRNYDMLRLKGRIIDKFYEISSFLHSLCDDMSISRIFYHDSWDKYAGRGCIRRISPELLGEARNNWRETKNESLSTLLGLYKETNKIIEEISEFLVENQKKECNTLSLAFKQGISDIVNGPYYYSYLTKEEIEKQSKENKQHKLEMKKR